MNEMLKETTIEKEPVEFIKEAFEPEIKQELEGQDQVKVEHKLEDQHSRVEAKSQENDDMEA